MKGFNPTSAFKEYLVSAGFTETIYADRDRPTSSIPNVFVEVDQNGSIRAISNKGGVKFCMLLVGIYVKLLSNDTANSMMEESILSKLSDLLSRNSVQSGEYHFILNNEMVGKGKNVTAGYSYILLNVDTWIY